jgi:hypothetical protein
VKQRSIFKDGYSVTYAIWKTYLAFYTNLLRLAYGSGKHQRHANWGRHNYQRLLTKWLTSWGIRHQTLHRQQTRPSELLHPSHLHQQDYSALSRVYIEKLIADIKSRLHGEERHRMRRAVNAEILRRDELREKQKMGELIQALNNKPQAHPQLHTLPSPVYGQITDPVLIQKELNDYFRAWFALPENSDPAAERLARDPEW